MARATAGSLVTVGTRGSLLALAQTEWVMHRLHATAPTLQFSSRVIRTTGDSSAAAARGDGVFVKEIQRALLRGEIDLAVHSLKDLPTATVEGLVIAAVPPRADARDALVGGTLASLPSGARVGTGSARRAAQIKRLRDDLEVVPIRGNVPTRVEAVRAGTFDAAILAAAGLQRLGMEPDEIFDTDTLLPAPGQGALAIEVRRDSHLLEVVSVLDDPVTRASITAERTVLAALGGGCMLPVGAFARVHGNNLLVDAAVVSPDGRSEARTRHIGNPYEAEKAGRLVASRLKDLGALDLL